MSPLPTTPAAYWHPESSLSRVYYLRSNGTWYDTIAGREVQPEQVPEDVRFLANCRMGQS